MAVLAGAGILSASGTASAANTDHSHLDEAWTGDPGKRGILVHTGSNTPKAIEGASNADNARAFVGYATSSTGYTRGFQGRVDSPKGIGVFGTAKANSGFAKGVEGRTAASGGTGVVGNATSESGTTTGVKGKVNSPDGYGLYTPDDAKVDQTLEVGGDLQVSGTKNFVQTVDTTGGPKQVAYTAVEAGEPRTETTDVAEMDAGRAEIELPEHFDMVTSEEEPLSVQVTPYAKDQVHPQVVETSTEQIVVEDFGDGPQDYTFSYTVKGVREGFEDQEIVRDP